MKKKVFISGGAGVIGTSLVNLLIRKKNYEIFVGDIKDKPQDFKNKILYRKGDLNFLTEDEIKNFQPEIFIHLAEFLNVQMSHIISMIIISETTLP